MKKNNKKRYSLKKYPGGGLTSQDGEAIGAFASSAITMNPLPFLSFIADTALSKNPGTLVDLANHTDYSNYINSINSQQLTTGLNEEQLSMSGVKGKYDRMVNSLGKSGYVNQLPIKKVDTSSEYLFPDGGITNRGFGNTAELEKKEVYQLPNGKVGNVDGPSHENGGVGVNLPTGTRIWSDRLKSGNKTFAQKAKPISDKIKRIQGNEYLDKDNIAKNTVKILNSQLDNLFNEQESMKDQDALDFMMNGGTIEYAKGGIHINPANKGKFNALKKRTGKTTEELTHSKNPLTRKRAIFAQNARKWKHPDGGVIYNDLEDFYKNYNNSPTGNPPIINPDEENYDSPNQFSPYSKSGNLDEVYNTIGQSFSSIDPTKFSGSSMEFKPGDIAKGLNKALPYIGPANQLLSSYKKDPVNRIRNKEYGSSLADLSSAEAMLPSQYDISPMLGEINSGDASFRRTVGNRLSGPQAISALGANKANNLRLKSQLYTEKFNKENAMKVAKAEARANIGRFRSSLGSQDAEYQRTYDIDKLQNEANRRTIRNSALSNISQNKMMSDNDRLRISLLKDIIPNFEFDETSGSFKPRTTLKTK